MKNQLKTTKPKDRKDRRHINWGAFSFCRVPQRHDAGGKHDARLCGDNGMGKGKRDHEGCVYADSHDLYHCRRCDRRYRTSDDEFLQIGTDG